MNEEIQSANVKNQLPLQYFDFFCNLGSCKKYKIAGIFNNISVIICPTFINTSLDRQIGNINICKNRKSNVWSVTKILGGYNEKTEKTSLEELVV